MISMQIQEGQNVDNLATQGFVFPKLYGLNIRSTDWENWSCSEIDKELVNLKNLGFNFVRFEVYFHRLIDWTKPALYVSRNQSYYDKLLYFLRALDKNQIFSEPLLMEPWKFGDKMEWWWTNVTLQNRIRFFYKTYAEWLNDMGLKNIVYITLWSEASYYYEWTDGGYVVEKNMPNYEETNIDWKEWLRQNGKPPVDLSIDSIVSNIDQYREWSRSRFNLITQIKAKAVKEGWFSMRTAAEMGYPVEECGTGPEYHPSRYLQLCAKEYVDVLLVHDYVDNAYWMLEPYLAAAGSKIVVANELGPPFYLGVYANDTERWWRALQPKMESMSTKACGFAIWCLTDYNNEPWGLRDLSLNARPVLQLVSNWLNNQSLH